MKTFLIPEEVKDQLKKMAMNEIIAKTSENYMNCGIGTIRKARQGSTGADISKDLMDRVAAIQRKMKMRTIDWQQLYFLCLAIPAGLSTVHSQDEKETFHWSPRNGVYISNGAYMWSQLWAPELEAILKKYSFPPDEILCVLETLKATSGFSNTTLRLPVEYIMFLTIYDLYVEGK